MHISFPDLNYSDALDVACISTAFDRRDKLSCELFEDMIKNKDHKLASLLSPRAIHCNELRNVRSFIVPNCKTDRFNNSFIVLAGVLTCITSPYFI